MWIVVVVDNFYPSVYHFDNKEDAIRSYNKERSMGHIIHLAEVKDSKVNEDNFSIDFDYGRNDIEALDVEWYDGR